jgi:sugar phosphate isomerase/epimerase
MWSFKVTPDGGFKPWSSGLRTANGIGMNLDGELFAADNQGDWVPTSMLHHLTKGAFHGNAKALRWDETFAHRKDPTKAPLAELDQLRKMPAVHFPHGELANSPGSPICDTTGGKFGPFSGQMFIGDVVQPHLIRIALEKIKGQYQGACFPFIKGGTLKRGICRLQFSPEGELIVGRVGEGDWARGKPGHGLQKIVYNGKMPFEIHSIQLVNDGFVLQFTEPVDPAVCANPAAYKLVNYHYKYSGAYGSPKTDLKPVAIRSVKIADDHRSVHLKIDGLTPRKIYEFKLSGLVNQAGKKLRHHMAYYTLNELSETNFDSKSPGLSPLAKKSVSRSFFPYVPSISDSAKHSLAEQAKLYRELGYDGAGELAQELGFPDFGHPKGVTVPERVASLEEEGLRLNLVTGQIRLEQKQAIDLAKVKEIMPALARHKTILGVVLSGNRKADLDAKAVAVLNQLADLAEPHGVEIAIYPHAGDYLQTVEEAVRVAAKVKRPKQVGVIFNLYHWMLVDRDRTLKAALTQARPWLKIINIHGSSKDKAQILPLDQGDFDQSQIISILDEIDYCGPVGLFCYSIGGDARKHLTASMNKWKSLSPQVPEDAIILFDGTDTSAWMQHSGMRMPTNEEVKNAAPCHYKIIDGALEVTDPGHLVTKQRFNDFRFHTEVWLPDEEGMNSGIWTHFRYCNAIRGRGEKDGKYRLGAIYGLKPPDIDASKPADTWQTLDITFRNARFDKAGKKTEKARMTVLLNGKKVHDDVELPSICPTLIEPEGATPGPIVLENHSAAGRVRFRNIWVQPL